ncbi:hypothetical protein [Actinomadura madurae]|uniref:hypothetical protein n=1 Tax=Actinomadura madurae TaxID=1993 RepID=UPI0020D209F8|nr:hypothetical protein [Actinomadura madurae]MCP9948015.1 hypothetical protein [Actinomadura madurae]MCP9977268.1 hypothetical protein [Actinomadura madurae]
MSAEEDGRGDDSRERRGDNGRRNAPARRGGYPRGGQGASPSGPRKGGGPRGGAPRGGAPRAGGPQGGRGRPGGGKEWDARGKREDRGQRGERRFDGPRAGQGRPGERRPSGGQGGERREGRPAGPRGPRAGQGGGPRRDGRPGGPQSRGGQGERRFEGRPQDRPARGRRDERDERRSGARPFEGKREGRPGGRRFEGKREGRPGEREKPFKGRGGPKRPQDRRRQDGRPQGAGNRSYGPPRERDDRKARFEERERPAPKHDDPLLPDEVTGDELDADARVELRTLPKELAAKVARHLVMAGRLAEEEPELSYRHAKAARRLASRVGIVREAAGIAAYHAGEWAEALAELRAARRLGAGDDAYLPLMADCERGLGRPERALDLIKSPEAEKLDPMGRVELRIVESGVRRDLGQYDAAVVTLQIPELRDRRLRPWSMRLFYAYADALVEAGREGEAADWFARAAAADRDGDTDAAERYAEIEGLHILDTEEDGEAQTGEAQADAEQAGGDQGAEPGEVSATDIAFKPAEPEVQDAPDEDAPEAAAVFLEPKPAGEEQPPPAE